MTFNNFTEVSNVNDVIAVKVSYDGQIRRASFTGASYAALCELIAKLFEVDLATVALKYEDEEGDKITVSSDAELKEAIQLANGAHKTVRLLIEAKTAAAHANEGVGDAAPGFCGGPFRHFGRGRWGGRFPHGHPFPHAHPHSHLFHARFHPGPFAAAPTNAAAGARGAAPGTGPQVPFARCGFPPFVASGEFAPADANQAPTVHPSKEEEIHRRMEYKALKDHKRSMRETLKEMKKSARTEEERAAMKMFKQHMKTEFKDAYKGFKFQKDPTRLNSRHVADITIPDNSELPPDTPIVKTWRLRNVGQAEWPIGCQLLFVSRNGDTLDGPERVVLEVPVPPQQEVDVSVPIVTPSKPGRYVAYYRMASPDGAKFGQRVWVSFIVPAPREAIATTTTTASAASAMDQ